MFYSEYVPVNGYWKSIKAFAMFVLSLNGLNELFIKRTNSSNYSERQFPKTQTRTTPYFCKKEEDSNHKAQKLPTIRIQKK